MKSLARPDFLNTKSLLSAELMNALAEIPHVLTDSFGNLLSSSQPEALPPEIIEILLENVPVAKLRAPQNLREILRNFLQAELLQQFRALVVNNALEQENLLSDDLEQILRISEIDAFPFEKQIQHFLKILRSHIWCESAAVFSLFDGFTLEGIASVGASNGSDWKSEYSPAASLVASTKKILQSENPANDPNLKFASMNPPRNLLCLPLIHGSTLVGVLTLGNRIGGPFQNQDVVMLKRFARVAAHILQKHFFKQKMQDFEKASGQLGKYLSSKVAKSVGTAKEIELGGVEKKVICLFADIRGYTSITEDIGPAKLVTLLNFYFERMSAVIEKNEGTLDKIVGDLIMAVWNMPNDQPEAELLAMKTAIEMQKEMIRTVSPEWAKSGLPKVGMGIGVNAGIALVGNLGSSRFMNYTVIGDAVNIAQRLEAKAQPGEIWMAEDLFEIVQGKIEKPARKECDIRLKGKDKTINAFVYRPLSY